MLSFNYVEKDTSTSIDTSNSIIIIGPASTNSYLCTPFKPSSHKEAIKTYGDSPLYNAYLECSKTLAGNVYLVNARRTSDYIKITDLLIQYNFNYIIPIELYFSDSFYHPQLNRQMTYAEYYTLSLGEYTNSLIIMKDHNASVYESIDHFLKDMKEKVNNIRNIGYGALKSYGRNLLLIGDNLKNYKYANVVLAGAMANKKFGYPEFDFGDTIYDIDDFDMGINPFCYFKDNILRETTVENLYNMRLEDDLDKFVPVDLIVRYIERNLDLSHYKGKTYTEYIKYLIHNEVSAFMDKLVSIAIKSYSIISIDFSLNDDYSGNIKVSMSFVPIDSAEEYQITVEV